MPTGPKGEKRSTSEVANALWIAKVATGQVDLPQVFGPLRNS